MNWKPGVDPSRAKHLAELATDDEQSFADGRVVAWQLIRQKEREYIDHGAHKAEKQRKKMGRPPVAVKSDKGEEFESMAAAEEFLGLSHGQIYYAVKTGCMVAGRHWHRMRVG